MQNLGPSSTAKQSEGTSTKHNHTGWLRDRRDAKNLLAEVAGSRNAFPESEARVRAEVAVAEGCSAVRAEDRIVVDEVLHALGQGHRAVVEHGETARREVGERRGAERGVRVPRVRRREVAFGGRTVLAEAVPERVVPHLPARVPGGGRHVRRRVAHIEGGDTVVRAETGGRGDVVSASIAMEEEGRTAGGARVLDANADDAVTSLPDAAEEAACRLAGVADSVARSAVGDARAAHGLTRAQNEGGAVDVVGAGGRTLHPGPRGL